mmetsp:Transcript_32186/g.75570  ORF Transcript_32186/g.75570 Transcript_32186/m.75570 type:complete len:648 (+) Transcript_32186:66-2009(+)
MAPTKAKAKAKAAADLDPAALLRATEKATNGQLLIMNRCFACHGKTVRDVTGEIVDGRKYTKSDLRYDLKQGRLELVKKGQEVGPLPRGKIRKDAPCAGEPLPDATLDEFIQFLQCQLRVEAREHLGIEVAVKDPKALDMWPEVDAFVKPNLGATERWVPYHTVLGIHELFLVQNVHNRKSWSEKQRFIAMFMFRAHCKCDLFMQVQLPIMEKDEFWKDPAHAFRPGGPMEKAMLAYRRKTGAPLLTNCFRIIPERILKDDDENLVRSITNRSQRLVPVAEEAFAVMKDKKRSPTEKLEAMSAMVQDTQGMGETWSKMLTVCIDLAYPQERLLETDCDVGTGAAPPLRALRPDQKGVERKEALKILLDDVNASKTSSSKHFWTLLKEVEGKLRTKFKAHPLVTKQANTKPHGMSAVTLQVQLCEYRQFRHALARNKYGLPDDESMRGDPDTTGRVDPEKYFTHDKKRNVLVSTFNMGGKQCGYEVPVKPFKMKQVAMRVGCMMFQKMQNGETQKEAEKFRDQLAKGYTHGEDVPEDSDAWKVCRFTPSSAGVVGFYVEKKDGTRFPFQTTVTAAGSILQAERVARLCWQKLTAGKDKETVLKFRNALYEQLNPNGFKRTLSQDSLSGPPTKVQRTKSSSSVRSTRSA